MGALLILLAIQALIEGPKLDAEFERLMRESSERDNGEAPTGPTEPD